MDFNSTITIKNSHAKAQMENWSSDVGVINPARSTNDTAIRVATSRSSFTYLLNPSSIFFTASGLKSPRGFLSRFCNNSS